LVFFFFFWKWFLYNTIYTIFTQHNHREWDPCDRSYSHRSYPMWVCCVNIIFLSLCPSIRQWEWSLHSLCTTMVQHQGTLGWDPMCGPHSNVSSCCVIVVHCECFDYFSLDNAKKNTCIRLSIRRQIRTYINKCSIQG
jgi:hypothetical protein